MLSAALIEEPRRHNRLAFAMSAVWKVMVSAALILLIVMAIQQQTSTDTVHHVNTAVAVTHGLGVASSLVVVTLPLSSRACSDGALLMNGTSLSYSRTDGAVTFGSGTSAYIGAQQHTYHGFTPNHLALVSLSNDTVLWSIGQFLVVGRASADWVTGTQVVFNGTSAPSPSGWGAFYPLPVGADDVVLLSSSNGYAIVVAVAGGGAIAARVTLSTGSITFGAVKKFATGPSVDTDTAALSANTFAISYYQDGANNSIALNTIAGSVDATSLTITFGEAVTYSPNHMFHQIVSLGAGNLYALAFPHDNLNIPSSADSPMGVIIASVDENNAVSIWTDDGGAPWLTSNVRGYYFFDMILIDSVITEDLYTATVAMAVIDRSVADALVVLTFNVAADIDGSRNVADISCLFRHQISVTGPAATVGYNYFAMQPLFILPPAATLNRPSVPTQVRDFTVVWQDTAFSGAVEAVVISFSSVTGQLSVVMSTTAITAPIPKSSSDHWWITGGALPDGRVMIMSTFDNVGNMTILEHSSRSLGVAVENVDCQKQSTIAVVVSGVVSAATLPSSTTDITVWSTTRGALISGQVATMKTDVGVVTVAVGADACVGLTTTEGAAVWINPDVCSRY